MSKCKAGQDAGLVQSLGIEKYDGAGRLLRAPLRSATNDLEKRRNALAQLLLDLSDATNLIEGVARSFGRADDLTVLSLAELEKRSQALAGKIVDYLPVRGYAMGVDFETVAKDYVENQIHFHAAQVAFRDVQQAIRDQGEVE